MEVMEVTEIEQIQKMWKNFQGCKIIWQIQIKNPLHTKKMKKRYIELKVILNTFGVNITELDYIKE